MEWLNYCLMKIMKAIQRKDDNIRQILKDEPMKYIQTFTKCNKECLGISNKSRFTFLNIYEDIEKL